MSFLLLAQKKETKKSAAKNIPIDIGTAVFGGPTHMNTPMICNWFQLLKWLHEVLASCYAKLMEALSFSLAFFKWAVDLNSGEKEGARPTKIFYMSTGGFLHIWFKIDAI